MQRTMSLPRYSVLLAIFSMRSLCKIALYVCLSVSIQPKELKECIQACKTNRTIVQRIAVWPGSYYTSASPTATNFKIQLTSLSARSWTIILLDLFQSFLVSINFFSSQIPLNFARVVNNCLGASGPLLSLSSSVG